MEVAKKSLKRARRPWWQQAQLILSILWIRIMSSTSKEAIVRTYDKEYGSASNRYGYVSAILSKRGFELITGIDPVKAQGLHILDIGAGSNEFLRFCRDELGIPALQLSGADISPASVKIIEEDGFVAYQGRIEELHLPKDALDIAYLSYFIDYDTDQAATFNAVIDLVKPGGKIVLEGQFPVRPFALLKKDRSTFSFITKGESVEGDIGLISQAFACLGKGKGKRVCLERVFDTHRYVQSHYGFNRLPSLFLVFGVE